MSALPRAADGQGKREGSSEMGANLALLYTYTDLYLALKRISSKRPGRPERKVRSAHGLEHLLRWHRIPDQTELRLIEAFPVATEL